MQGSFIVVYDSGVGGLTLLRECVRRLPGENFLYYGDNENAPYGNRSPQEIRELVFRSFENITGARVRAIVLACNTVTAVCAEELRRRYSFPVLGLEPAVKPAVRRGGRILLLATRATLESERVKRLVSECSGLADIFPYCPENLAGEVEKNILRLSSVDLRAHLPQGRFDSVVLGCTHYIFLRERIEEMYGCPVLDGNSGTADHLAKSLNICSENTPKIAQNCPVFFGKSQNLNKSVYKLLL